MPTGPQGQKRPADAIGLAVTIGKIATGEIEETAIRKPRGQSGGVARAMSLSAERRIEIASAGAGVRWDAQGREAKAMSTVTKHGASVAEGAALQMYPNNRLKAPVREFSAKSAVTTILRDHFAKR